MTKLIDDIRDFTKAPKNGSYLLLFETPHLQKLQVYTLRHTAVLFTVMWFIAHAQKEHSHRTSTCCPTRENGYSFQPKDTRLFAGAENVGSWRQLTARGSENYVKSRLQVAKWCHTFASERDSVTDDSPGARRSSWTTEVDTSSVEERRRPGELTSRRVASDLGLF